MTLQIFHFFLYSAANDLHQIIDGNEKATQIKLLPKRTHTHNAIHDWMVLNMCMCTNYLIRSSMACMSKLILNFCRLFKYSCDYRRQFVKWARFFFFSWCKQKRSPTKKLSGYEWSRCSILLNVMSCITTIHPKRIVAFSSPLLSSQSRPKHKKT